VYIASFDAAELIYPNAMRDSRHIAKGDRVTFLSSQNHSASRVESLCSAVETEKISLSKSIAYPSRRTAMKRQSIYALTLTAALAASVIPAYADPVAPSSRGSHDSRAMCNDVNVGYNVQKNIHQQNDIHGYEQADVTNQTSAYDWMNSSSKSSSSSAGGGGGFSFLGFGASGSGSSSSQNSSSTYNSGSTSDTYYHDGSSKGYSDTSSYSDTSTVSTVVGQDCSAVVQSQTQTINHLLSW
jgi:hypothetical protein